MNLAPTCTKKNTTSEGDRHKPTSGIKKKKKETQPFNIIIFFLPSIDRKGVGRKRA
jgi:hypothetical protein